MRYIQRVYNHFRAYYFAINSITEAVQKKFVYTDRYISPFGIGRRDGRIVSYSSKCNFKYIRLSFINFHYHFLKRFSGNDGFVAYSSTIVVDGISRIM